MHQETSVKARRRDFLGENFEDTEQIKFGKDGFVKMVAGLEKTLGIFDLARFTPPA